jgi:hypothetical protein
MNGTAASLITGDWALLIVGSKVNDPDSVNYNDKWFRFNGTQGHTPQTIFTGGIKYVCTTTVDCTTPGPFGIGTSPAYISWTCVDGAIPQVRCNGVALSTATSRPATSGITGYQIGGANLSFFDGSIGEIVALNAVPSAAQLAAWESYVKKFWGFP